MEPILAHSFDALNADRITRNRNYITVVMGVVFLGLSIAQFHHYSGITAANFRSVGEWAVGISGLRVAIYLMDIALNFLLRAGADRELALLQNVIFSKQERPEKVEILKQSFRARWEEKIWRIGSATVAFSNGKHAKLGHWGKLRPGSRALVYTVPGIFGFNKQFLVSEALVAKMQSKPRDKAA